MRVLLIEDDPDIRHLAKLSLEISTHWQVDAVETGLAGISMAMRVRPELILLDYQMPDVDGPETLRRLRLDARTSSIPVIFFSAKVLASDKQKMKCEGVVGLIAKPFDPLTLASEIERILADAGHS